MNKFNFVFAVVMSLVSFGVMAKEYSKPMQTVVPVNNCNETVVQGNRVIYCVYPTNNNGINLHVMIYNPYGVMVGETLGYCDTGEPVESTQLSNLLLCVTGNSSTY